MAHEVYNHHPLLTNSEGRSRLPATHWHRKVQDRYPLGSEVELFRRAQEFFYNGLSRIREKPLTQPPMQPPENLLDKINGPAVDIIAPSIVITTGCQAQTIIIIEDHVHQPETRFTMGKSSLTQSLLGIPPVEDLTRTLLKIPPNEKIPAREFKAKMEEIKFNSDKTLDIGSDENPRASLIAGDVTFIGASEEGALVALPTAGTKEDFMFDIARSTTRKIISDYDRVNNDIMSAQIDLTEKLKLSDAIFSKIDSAYPIDEVVCISLSPDLDELAKWGKSLTSRSSVHDLRRQIRNNPLYIAQEIGYWNIDADVHGQQVDEVFAHIRQSPQVLYLLVKDPKNPDSLKAATDLMKNRYLTPN